MSGSATARRERSSGQRIAAWAGALSCALGCAGCGYRAVYGGEAPERLHVRLVRTLVPDVVASDEVVSGVREELARAGRLEAGDGWPRAEVEVLRAEESSEGVVARGEAPRARATAIALVARAWVVVAPGRAFERDTGDVRAQAILGVGASLVAPDPVENGFRFPDAERAAARRLGTKLARRLMGFPAPSESNDARKASEATGRWSKASEATSRWSKASGEKHADASVSARERRREFGRAVLECLPPL